MRISNFIKYGASICLLSAAFVLAGCNDDAKTTTPSYTNGYHSGETTTSAVKPTNPVEAATTTLPEPEFDLPTLTADNISVAAGESIDYISNLTIEGAGETDVTQISVNTSKVRPLVPGIYNATYTVTYRGYPVSKTIVVTITEPEPTSSVKVFPSELSGDSIGDMSITLLSGETCLIPCTTEHFIMSSDTIDTYSTVDGNTYLTSVLRITFSDGETVDIETTYNRATPQ